MNAIVEVYCDECRDLMGSEVIDQETVPDTIKETIQKIINNHQPYCPGPPILPGEHIGDEDAQR